MPWLRQQRHGLLEEDPGKMEARVRRLGRPLGFGALSAPRSAGLSTPELCPHRLFGGDLAVQDDISELLEHLAHELGEAEERPRSRFVASGASQECAERIARERAAFTRT